jgi:alpha-N-arabinofuranosidase
VAFQNETHNYFVGVERTKDTTVVELVMNAGSSVKDSVIARVPVRLDAGRPITLRVDADKGVYRFFYGRRDGEWIPLGGDADGTILSTKKAGGFVGTLFGMYAVQASR